jgi:ParB-like chromosome segregation protein Spo0J
MHNTQRMLPALSLNPAATNVRTQTSPEALASMKASILAKGIIQNLIAAPVAKGSEQLAVVAGSTRFSAVLELIEEGKLPRDTTVPVIVRPDIVAGDVEALAIALTENVVRTSMDYVDECSAMLALAKGGKTEADIAGIFGYRPRTVHERLLIAGLIPEAKELLRTGDRTIEWARAMTMADATFQTRVVQDIAGNPASWKEGSDIRAHLTRSTVPAAHALFDADAYTGPIVSDFFEGDAFADVAAFWTLQNEAVAGLETDLVGEGYTVEILRNTPFPDWLYEDAPAGTKGAAVVEVMANGRVRVIKGKVKIHTPESTDTGGLDGFTTTQDTSVAAWEVRPIGRVLDYAQAQKSAMIQNRLAGDFDAALRYATLAMLGAAGAAFAAQPFAFPGSAEIRVGEAWRGVDGALAEEQALRDADPALVATVCAMDRAALEKLFSAVVARRAGLKRNAPDGNANSLANVLAGDVDVRAFWTPDAAFFNLLPTPDLRRLAAHLVPSFSGRTAQTNSRKTLVRTLADAFRNAKAGKMYGPAAERLNTWVPGVMSFPAVVATHQDALEALETVDAGDALFGAF